LPHYGDCESAFKPRGFDEGGGPNQPHPGTRVHCCGCSLPGLTGFTVFRCEGTDSGHHNAVFNQQKQVVVTIHSMDKLYFATADSNFAALLWRGGIMGSSRPLVNLEQDDGSKNHPIRSQKPGGHSYSVAPALQSAHHCFSTLP